MMAGFNRRDFMKQLGVAGSALVLTPASLSAQSGRRLRAAVLEHRDRWTSLTGAAVLLERAGFEVKELPLDQPATDLGADLIVLGSFCSEHPGYKDYMRKHGASLTAFVAAGGVVVQFAQADQHEAQVPFLPQSLQARRTDDDYPQLYVRDTKHPLFAGLNVGDADAPAIALGDFIERPASWESISQREGFKVLLSAHALDARVAMIEGSHERGRVIISSLWIDCLYDANGKTKYADEYVKFCEQIFINLRQYVTLVKAQRAPMVNADPPYKEPEPWDFVPGALTLALLPDTQKYSETYHDYFHAQTQWIVDHREKNNIQYVLHLGDIVNRGGDDMKQWDVAQAAMKRLYGHVPYSLCVGNHDYHDNKGAKRTTPVNDYFHIDDYKKWPSFGPEMEKGKLDNTYHQFRMGKEDFLVFALEFGPRLETIDWANRIVAKHPKHRVIVTTHAYLYSDDTRYDWDAKGRKQHWNPRGYIPENVSDGEMMWRDFISRHRNIELVAGGHVLNDGLGLLSSKAAHGNTVHQMLVNYQMRPEGGAGYLRLLEFLPDGKTIHARTYSPVKDAFKTGPDNQFKLSRG